MTLMSRLIAKLMKLPQASTYAVDGEKHLPVPTPVEAVLLVDQLSMISKDIHRHV